MERPGVADPDEAVEVIGRTARLERSRPHGVRRLPLDLRPGRSGAVSTLALHVL